MNDNLENSEPRPDAAAGTSRRNALKMGVAAGIGVVAWSGPTITSLGGTPVYAAGCTFIVELDLTAGCRNTAQANCGDATATIKYLPISLPADAPTGYTLSVSPAIPGSGWCNNDLATNPTLTFNSPAGIECRLHMDLMASSCGVLLRRYVWGDTFGEPTDGQITAQLPDNQAYVLAAPYSIGPVPQPAIFDNGTGEIDNKTVWEEFDGKVGNGNFFYRIYVRCASVGAPAECLNPT